MGEILTYCAIAVGIVFVGLLIVAIAVFAKKPQTDNAEEPAAEAAGEAAPAEAFAEPQESAAERKARIKAEKEAAQKAAAEEKAAAKAAKAQKAEVKEAAATVAPVTPVAPVAPVSPAEEADEEGDAASFEDETAGDEVRETYDEATGKRYRYRYEFSFSARLIQATPEQQARYGWVMDEANAHAGVKAEVSWKHQRIAAGRKTLAVVFFQGTQMCMAFAIDPEDIEGEPKFRLTDVSNVKRFKSTPYLLKITSDAKARYAQELLRLAASEQGIARTQKSAGGEKFSIPFRPTEELVSEGLIKLFTSEIV